MNVLYRLLRIVHRNIGQIAQMARVDTHDGNALVANPGGCFQKRAVTADAECRIRCKVVGGQYACRFRQLNVPGQIFMKALLDICPHSQSGERCKHSVERFDMLVLIKVSVDGYSHVCSFLSNRLSFGGG